jgi:hypothetical protein
MRPTNEFARSSFGSTLLKLMCVTAFVIYALFAPGCVLWSDGTIASSDTQTSGPPPAQEGDDEIIQTTVGKMRVALWYYDAYRATKPKYDALLEDYGKCRSTAAVLEDALRDAVAKTNLLTIQKNWLTVGIGALALAVVGTTVGWIVTLRLGGVR